MVHKTVKTLTLAHHGKMIAETKALLLVIEGE